jgi:hypothetical protein
MLSGFIVYLFLYGKHLKFKRSSYLLIAFFLGSVFTGLYNAEIEIIAATAIFTFPLIAVNENLISIDSKLINFLFITTIIIGVVTFHLGYNEYGYLPGHSYLNGKTPWWRVSVFPTSTPTYSGFFSLLVYVYNINDKTLMGRILKAVSVYFIILSGSRSAVILFVAIFVYRFFKNKKKVQHILPYVILILPVLFIASEYMSVVADSDIAREYILRGQQSENIENTSIGYRIILWSNLISVYAESPVFGVGSFELYDYFPYAPSSSECKWLTLLASNGIFTVFLFLFFLKKYHNSVKLNQTFEPLSLLIIIFSMFYYGSFYTPYNIIFFLNILLLNKNDQKSIN